MMKIRKAKSPKQVRFRLGWNERIFLFLKNRKQQTDKQTYYSNKRVVERNVSSDPSAANTFHVLTLGTMIW